MRAWGRITAFSLTASLLGIFFACSDSGAPIGTGDKVINDTMGQDAYVPPPPSYASDAGEAGDGYGPALNTCGGCSCDPTKYYCFSGGTRRARESEPLGGVFGQPDAMPGPPPPPCKILDAGAAGLGCIPLPTACAKTPTCNCLLQNLQNDYSCFLVCSPTPGFLEVYCPHGS